MPSSDVACLLKEAETLFQAWRAKLHWGWRNSRQYWFAETPHESIWIDHETYHRVLKEELAKRGIEMKTWSEYMRPAEEAWNRQCAIEDKLKSSLDFWKQIQGVEVWTLNQHGRKE